MIRDPNNPIDNSEREGSLLRVLEEVTSRRGRGELVDDNTILSEHSNLMPELEDRLRALRRTEEALAEATGSSGRMDLSVPGPSSPRSNRPETEMTAIAGYQLCEVVGRGAMGVVYRAIEGKTQRAFAVKLMHDGPFVGGQERLRFEREAGILAQLRHPNIVAIHDTGWSLGRFYLVMDYIAGEALDVHVARQSLDVRSVLSLFAGICETVHAAHLRGVIHRDLKPSNIRVDADGEPHLLDFGLAKLESEDAALPAAHSMTMTGQFVGSLPWASPEQAEGAQDKIDLRTDIYSLGVMLFQLLTGRFPYPVVGNLRDVVDRILTAEPMRPRSINRDVDDEVETITLKCLAKDRQRRYQSAGELAADLRRYLTGEPIEAKRDSGWYVLRKSLWRHRAAVGVATGFVVLSIAFGVTMAVLYAKEQAESSRARRTLLFLQDVLFQASSQRLGSDATLAEVLDEASARLNAEFTTEPEIAAALHYTLGSAYETIWEKQRAIPHLRQSMEMYRKLRGSEAEETLGAMVLLGMVLAEQDRPESVELQRDALTIRLKKHGPKHRLVADGMGELAFALWAGASEPRWDEAERYYKDAVALYRDTVEPTDAYFARVLTGFASMRRVQGRFGEALALFEEALPMARAAVGERHQFAVECQIGYADVLTELGRTIEAKTQYQSALVRAPKLFGVRAVPAIMRKLALLEQTEGRLDEADRILFESVGYTCRHEVSARPEQSTELEPLCAALAGSDSDARDDAYRSAIARIHERNNRPLDAARDLFGLASLRQTQSRHDAALEYYRAGLDLLANTGSRFVSMRVSAHRATATSLRTLGRDGEAERTLLEALELSSAQLGEGAEPTTMMIEELERFYQSTGDSEKAKAMGAKRKRS